MPEGAKEENTLVAERRHQRFLKKHLKASTVAQSISTVDVQRYVSRRSSDVWQGEPIGAETIKKELATFRLVWNWAIDREYLKGPVPTKGVKLPKRSDKLPFMTRAEIEQKIGRGGLTTKQANHLWESLFLTSEQIADALEHVRSTARRAFIYPMFVFVAHTGARRSEIEKAVRKMHYWQTVAQGNEHSNSRCLPQRRLQAYHPVLASG